MLPGKPRKRSGLGVEVGAVRSCVRKHLLLLRRRGPLHRFAEPCEPREAPKRHARAPLASLVGMGGMQNARVDDLAGVFRLDGEM